MRGSGGTGVCPPPGGAATDGPSPTSHGERRPLVLRGVFGGSPSEEPTQAGPDVVASPLELAVGRDAVRRYETALNRLRRRDREALRGRIEKQWSYAEIGEALGLTTAATARAMVIRVLGRVVRGDEDARLDATGLAGLVASVADGWPQDWGALEARAGDGRARRGVRELRVVAEIAAFHRSLTEGETCRPGGPRGPSTPPGEPLAQGGDRTAPEDFPADARWGRFRLLKKLGEGAYGDVWSAHDTELDREVALKLLKPSRCSAELTQRLLDEARMLAQVRHPNVASVYGVGEHDGRAGFWMELIRGITLEEFLRSHGPMSASEAALLGWDLCRALAAVHGAGLVHRDVKTANVMREVGGRIVLMDFGAGGYRGQEPGRRFAGTPLYVAPEVSAGAEATVRSDIYSLGVVLFRLVTTSYPRKIGSFGEMLAARDVGAPPSLRDLRPDLPDSFVAVVECTLARDPAERPRSVGALRAALGAVLGVPAS